MSRNSIINTILSSPVFEDRPPILVDVGASGGMHAPWRAIARHSICIGFDPDDREFSTVNVDSGFRECHVVRAIVTDRDSPESTVYLTKSPYCSSTLRPRSDVLAKYAHARLFEIVGTTTAPSKRLDSVLATFSLDRIDWLKTDSQGLDRRVFESLSPERRQRTLVVELEPGVMDGYEGEDKLEDVLGAFAGSDFWCASLVAKGAVRGSSAVLERHLGPDIVSSISSTELPGAGWAEIEFMNTFTASSLHTIRDLQLGWVFATLRGHHAFALELADMGCRLFPGAEIFSRLVRHSTTGIVARYRVGLFRRGLRKLQRLVAGRS